MTDRAEPTDAELDQLVTAAHLLAKLSGLPVEETTGILKHLVSPGATLIYAVSVVEQGFQTESVLLNSCACGNRRTCKLVATAERDLRDWKHGKPSDVRAAKHS